MLTVLKSICYYSIGILLLLSIGLNWYQRKENKELIAENATIEMRLKTQQQQYEDAIAKLNKEIEEYSYNLDDYKSNVESCFVKIDTKYETIEKEIIKDTTLEEQMNRIESLLHDFSNKK